MKFSGRDMGRHSEEVSVYLADLHLVIETTVPERWVRADDLRCIIERAASAAANSYALASTRLVSVETTEPTPEPDEGAEG